MEDQIEPNARCLGCARVMSKHLRFPDRISNDDGTVVELRMLDPSNVKKLSKAFKLAGLRRYEPRNFIPVLISKSRLEAVLEDNRIAELPPSSSTSIPLLELGDVETLSCLHGRHRIEALKRIRKPAQRWWVVQFFPEGA